MRPSQTTSTVLMVRPDQFRFNAETAETNTFMSGAAGSNADVRSAALREFDGLVTALQHAGVEPLVFTGEHSHDTPDAVFPNNWFSTHETGELVLYPMEAKSRRSERRTDIIEAIQKRFGYTSTIDFSGLEQDALFLEGTGSIILDRENRIGYAGISSRTHLKALQLWSERLDFKIVPFSMADANGREIYHTNVMLSVGSSLAVICADSIPNATERSVVLDSLEQTGKEILLISHAQLGDFCGNLLEMKNTHGQAVWALSQRAWNAFDPTQRQRLAHSGVIVTADIATIENIGGGGVRCMLSEIFPATKR